LNDWRIEWNVEQVCAFVSSLGAPQSVIETFENELIDGRALASLTDQELKEDLKVPLGIRKKIIEAIKNPQPPLTVIPSSLQSSQIQSQSIDVSIVFSFVVMNFLLNKN